MFIVFEGIDGCGKSTHARLLAEWLREQGKDVLLTAEPTRGRIGEFIREILSGSMEVEPTTLALLFTADRAEHVTEVEKALGSGKTVVSERYFHSTVAYQSAQGVDRDWLLQLNGFAPEPDLLLFLDVDPGESAVRTTTGEIFETTEFLSRVREEYMKFDLRTIDTGRPRDAVQEQIRSIVAEQL